MRRNHLKILVFIIIFATSLHCSSIFNASHAQDEESYNENFSIPDDSLILIFMFNRCHRAFTHVSAVVNGTSKLIYDPGGSWMKPGPLPEHGFFENIDIRDIKDFIRYHDRPGNIIIKYPISISPDEMNYIHEFRQNAPLEEPGVCALRISALLKEIPRFRDIEISLFPRDIFTFVNKKLGQRFFMIPEKTASNADKILSSSKWNDFIANIYLQKFSWLGLDCLD